jgi:hypothetical protein
MDFTNFYKKKYYEVSDFASGNSYDVFVSAFNDSLRVKEVFEKASASEKHWLVFSEYKYEPSEIPTEGSSVRVFDCRIDSEISSEGELIRRYCKESGLSPSSKICIDITGFIRPHLLFIVRYLAEMKFDQIDFIYTDPIAYKAKENTSFSLDYIDVRQVDGFMGDHNPDSSNDYLIIGAGYDDQRITDVAKKKSNSKKIQLFGFPSLQADMFQENILKAYKAEEASSSGRENFIDGSSTLFAPANDPFVTASVIKEFIDNESKRKPITNIYLCPLSTKAQTLGFVLFYLAEGRRKEMSIIFPFCDKYSRETTEGISKIWKYTVVLPLLTT